MSIRKHLLNHREFVKFAVVGGAAFVVDTGIFEGLKATVLSPKPVTAKVISTLIATVFSYIFSREWSFNTRGGLRRRYEMIGFVVVSAIGLGLTTAPLYISRYWLHLEVPYISRVGQEVAVTADPFPGRSFSGVVTSTNQRAEFTPRNVQTQRDRLNLVFGVKIRVDNPRGELKPGMPADATFASLP